MTILYVSHDVAVPSGGVRMLYRHVEALSQAGLPAAVVQPTQRFQPWFTSSAPVVGEERLQALTSDDILVIPEDHHELLGHPSPVRRYVFAQSFALLLGPHVVSHAPSALGLSGAIAISPVIADYVRWIYGMEAEIVPNGIDLERFSPAQKQLAVGFMPRRQAVDAEIIQRGLRCQHPDLAHIPWLPIHGAGEAQTAGLLAQTALFLALSPVFEGFGLPPLEAMAAGCLVTGFCGIGGRVYANRHNGLWVDDGDHRAAIESLAQGLRQLRAKDGRAQAMIQAGRNTAALYSLAKQRECVIAFWRKALETPNR